jgi:DNA-directed RNA polymerase subunit RPC12/RpoP
MICLNCKKQIADDSTQCPYCGHVVEHKAQVKKEISLRRYQRWFFYVLISIIFIGMIVAIVFIYNQNTKLIETNVNINNDLTEREEALKVAELTLEEKIKVLEELEESLVEKESIISEQTEEFKKVVDEKFEAIEQVETCELGLSSADANIYSLIIKLGVGVTDSNLNKIPLADANLGGEDMDGDGLSNQVEKSMHTNDDKADTDGDGFDDKAEILSGFNPNGDGEIGLDLEFANAQKGKILLQVENNGEAWFVGQDTKRYFLGTPADAFRIMRSMEYWTEDYGGQL